MFNYTPLQQLYSLQKRCKIRLFTANIYRYVIRYVLLHMCMQIYLQFYSMFYRIVGLYYAISTHTMLIINGRLRLSGTFNTRQTFIALLAKTPQPRRITQAKQESPAVADKPARRLKSGPRVTQGHRK